MDIGINADALADVMQREQPRTAESVVAAMEGAVKVTATGSDGKPLAQWFTKENGEHIPVTPQEEEAFNALKLTARPGDSPAVAEAMAIMDGAYEGATESGAVDRERRALAALVTILQGLYPDYDPEALARAAGELMITATVRAAAMTQREQSQLFIAKVCHEVNRALCEGTGDTSQPTWDQATDQQRKNALTAVRTYHDNPLMTEVGAHGAWLIRMMKDGWAWGPVKSVERKLHPRIRTFDTLPQTEQAKYHVCRAIVVQMLGE